MKEWKFPEDIASSILDYRRNDKISVGVFFGVIGLIVALVITASVFSFLNLGAFLGIVATLFEAVGGLFLLKVFLDEVPLPGENSNDRFEKVFEHFLEQGKLSKKGNENSLEDNLKKAVVKEEDTIRKESIPGLEEKIKLTSIFMMGEDNRPIHLCQGESSYQLAEETPCYVEKKEKTKTLDKIDEFNSDDRFHFFLLEEDDTLEEVKKYYLERKN